MGRIRCGRVLLGLGAAILVLGLVSPAFAAQKLQTTPCDGGFITTCGNETISKIPDNMLYRYRPFDGGFQLDAWESSYQLCKATSVVTPLLNTSPGFNAFIYFLGIIYCFLGVALISDIFMASIEEITGQTKMVAYHDENGEERIEEVVVWNGTVANLTLMALGSSAPEILLALLETMMSINDKPGELGAGTIVGSAAFNLFLISGVCVYAIPGYTVKKLNDLSVFAVTAFFSIFAYLWLLIVLEMSSPDVVSIPEAMMTFLGFPTLVSIAYFTDRQWFGVALCNPRSREKLKASEQLQQDLDAAATPPTEMSDLKKGDAGGGKPGHVVIDMPDDSLKGSTNGGRKSSTGSNPDTGNGKRDSVQFGSVMSSEGTGRRSSVMKSGLATKQFRQLVRKHIDNGNLVPVETAGGGRKSTKLTIFEVAKEMMIKEDTAKPRQATYYRNAIRWLGGAPRLLPDNGEKYQAAHTVLKQQLGNGKPRKLNLKAIKAIQKHMARFNHGGTSWRQQFLDAMTVSGGVDDDGNEMEPTMTDCLKHIITFAWKVGFAFVPPPCFYGGWLTFWCSLMYIGGLVMVIGDLASLLGCSMGLSSYMTAITIVALGTSLPDTFASYKAATDEPYADNAIGNVTGSNSVNVFLGLGLPWVVASMYHDGRYQYPRGDLAFSVKSFCVLAGTCLALLMINRKFQGGELGGGNREILAASLVCLWLLYIILSAASASIRDSLFYATLGLCLSAIVGFWLLSKSRGPPPQRPETDLDDILSDIEVDADDEAPLSPRPADLKERRDKIIALSTMNTDALELNTVREDNKLLNDEIRQLKAIIRDQNGKLNKLNATSAAEMQSQPLLSEPLNLVTSTATGALHDTIEDTNSHVGDVSVAKDDKESFHKVALDVRIYLQERYHTRLIPIRELHRLAREEQIPREEWKKYCRVNLMQ
eukprot:GFYU01005036.1.p1 GENE.GFYU01005036.1~~GFYU01005036.1.p1  ORF type:complete len:932 (-),score=272.55 GFYU01005036.1:148-2943(-)